MPNFSSLNLQRWIEENAPAFRPPFRTNRVVAHHKEFIVMMLHGPNVRLDFHREPGEEFFYQVQGSIALHVKPAGEPRQVVTIGEGEIFLCPGGIAHSPRRGEGTWGLVIERKRAPEEKEEFIWFCEECDAEVASRSVIQSDIGAQVAEIYRAFNADAQMRTCKQCGYAFPESPIAERLSFLQRT